MSLRCEHRKHTTLNSVPPARRSASVSLVTVRKVATCVVSCVGVVLGRFTVKQKTMEDQLSSSQSGEDSVQVFLQEIEGKMGKNTIEALVTTLKSKDSTFVETLKRFIVEQV